ncbi:sulfatase-like hydrolase/transferase [Verrucomicrobiota bacterium sgz303538]
MRSAAAIESSIKTQLTWPVAAALVGVPGGYFAFARRGSRRDGIPAIVLCLFGLWMSLGWWKYVTRPEEWRLRQLSKNPHVELLQSAWVGMVGRAKPALPVDFPAEYKAEFQTFGNRERPTSGFVPMSGAARPKNVIVIVLESVGAKYLSLYGSRYGTTPNLVSEAKNALVFENFYAHVPYTFCSFMALNFSLYPGMPWCYIPNEAFSPDGKQGLPPTLASLMKQRGARTAYLHNGDLEWGGMDYVLDGQGYDLIQDYRGMDCPALTSWGAEDKFLIDRLIHWIDEKQGQPFYAFCWTDQTHDPYRLGPDTEPKDFFNGQPPENLREDLSRYLNVLHETDKHLGRLFQALRDRGIADDTLVVITGDHGEAFTDPHDQRGHGFTIFQEDVNVPLMLWNPRLFPEGKRVSTTIGGHVDVNATIADLVGLQVPTGWQGHSLFDPERPQRAFFLASIGEYLFGARDGRWKYTFGATSGQELLYDIVEDPAERNNVAGAQPQVCKELRERVAAWVAFEDELLRSPAK